jgi:hypothetical protein
MRFVSSCARAVAALLVSATALIAQQAGPSRVEFVRAAGAMSCEEARAVQFDARLSAAQRISARELLKKRTELLALDQALSAMLDARSGQQPVVVVRRGQRTRDSLSAAELDQEVDRLLRDIDSTFQRAARVRGRNSADVMVFDFNAPAADLQRVVGRASDLMVSVTSDLFGANRRPPGWIGVAITGEYLPRFTREGPAQWYCSDPIVESVVAGGPAERAGLARGDTLLSMNGQEMLGREVRVEPLLQPGTTITFRTRRAGRVRDVPVLVEPRPASAVASAPLRPNGFVVSTDSSGFTMSFGGSAPASPRGRVGPEEVASTISVLSGRDGSARGASWGSEGSATFIGGARFASLSPDMADALGVMSGVLVASVGTGSPASEAGFREGDVIFAVNGTPVRSPLQLLGFANKSRSLTVDVVRRGKSKTITFRF